MVTSAIRKFQGNSRFKFRFKIRGRRPYVLIVVEFAAVNFNHDSESLTERGFGITDTSAPVSTKKVNFAPESKIDRRLLLLTPPHAARSKGEFNLLSFEEFY